ncbi:PREDICTED: NAD(P)H-quinone oxidoreductase subunit T, chloroplastic [Ipomoea nil]|uniref:NAD(P)H-quinone oxidoreductase subunit T, chloroplastic n=1 Tax=Ipomoea nil TaxID=35883 RepID=UPI000901C23E|nr:PREDICTED: NAD(P)H-quinone oxidoreductase subunit T, chloroplastic [Ipomoea nil]
MASTTAPQSFFSILQRCRRTELRQSPAVERRRRPYGCRREVRIFATTQGPKPPPRQTAPPGVDTRIHWENEDEGWIGGSSSSSSTQEQQLKADENELLGDKFSELLNSSTDSHYQFLGVGADADVEEIKTAYRRLSKEYHPDTTSLPLKAASEKFMKLKEVYEVLSNDEKRRFYDWTLAQEAASKEAEKLRMKFQDPHMQEVENWESVPDMVDRLGGKNMELSSQAKSALTFDILIILFSVCCIVYAIYFKEQY